MADPAARKVPHHVDKHVGRQIRELRRRLHFSQEKLAKTLGLTFQQVQKYEMGSNRVSASKLFEVAGALGVDISYFFRGLAAPARAAGLADGSTETAIQEAPATAEGREIDALLVNMTRKKRRLMVDLARALAEDAAFSEELDAR